MLCLSNSSLQEGFIFLEVWSLATFSVDSTKFRIAFFKLLARFIKASFSLSTNLEVLRCFRKLVLLRSFSDFSVLALSKDISLSVSSFDLLRSSAPKRGFSEWEILMWWSFEVVENHDQKISRNCFLRFPRQIEKNWIFKSCKTFCCNQFRTFDDCVLSYSLTRHEYWTSTNELVSLI